MTLFSRRLIYLSFILVFIIAGFLILFYLQGYRFDTNDWEIKRTGAIQVESRPKGAKIKLNGQILSNSTPTTILSLSPGEYNLDIIMEGFQTWSKKIKVLPSEVVFSGDVILWPEPNTGQPLEINGLQKSWLSNNGESLLYLTKANSASELWLLNLKSSQTNLLTRTTESEIINAVWSPLNREILIQERIKDKNLWKIYNLENGLWEELPTPGSLNFNVVQWSKEKNLLYASTTTELYEINLKNNSHRIIWRERLVDFRIRHNIVFGLNRNGEALNLKLLNLSNLKTLPLPEMSILSSNVNFLDNSGDWVPLFDIDRHTLYLLNSPLIEEKPIRRLPDVTAINWQNENSLTITNNFEIWLYDPQKDSLEFVERLGTSLNGAWRYAEEQYVIFYGANEVWVIELDTRGNRQRWLLSNYEQDVVKIMLSPDHKTLYVQTTTDIYRLNLQPETRSFLQPTDLPSTMIQKYLRPSNNQ